jgi:hypothetical protein
MRRCRVRQVLVWRLRTRGLPEGQLLQSQCGFDIPSFFPPIEYEVVTFGTFQTAKILALARKLYELEIGQGSRDKG